MSDHAPLSFTLSHPGSRLGCLSRFWATDDRLQEPITESLCTYWTTNGDAGPPTVKWDEFKAWVRVAYISRTAILQREASRSLEFLENKVAGLEAEYVSPDPGEVSGLAKNLETIIPF